VSQLHVYQGDFQTTRLAVDVRSPELTVNRETDVAGAVTRGLSEYLMQCELHDWSDGRAYAFRSAHDQAPMSHDDRIDMPSVTVAVEDVAIMAGLGDGDVGATNLLDLAQLANRGAITGVEVEARLRVTVSAQNRDERSAMLALIQDALTADMGLLQVRLLLPFYHNAVAVYGMQRVANFNDGGEKRIWQAVIQVTANAPLVRLYPPSSTPPIDVRHYLDAQYTGKVQYPIVRPLSPTLHQRIIGVASDG